MMKRFLSMLLALTLVFSMVPQAAFAAEQTLFGLITGTEAASNDTLNQILALKSVLPDLAAMDIPLEDAQAPAQAAARLEGGILTAEAIGAWLPAYYVLEGEKIPFQGSAQINGCPEPVSVVYANPDLGSGRIQGVYEYIAAVAGETATQKSLLDNLSTNNMLTALSMLESGFIEDMMDSVNGLSRWELGFSDISKEELAQIKAEYIGIIEQLLDRLVTGSDPYMAYVNRKGKPIYQNYLRVYAMLSEYSDQGLYHYYGNYSDIITELRLLSGCLQDILGQQQADGTYSNEDVLNALLRRMGYGLITATDLAGVAERMIYVANTLPGCCTYIPATDLRDPDAVKALFGQDRSVTPLIIRFRSQELNGIIPAESEPLTIPTIHAPAHKDALPPTCTENGNPEYWHCTACGSIWLDEAMTQAAAAEDVLLPALGHDTLHVPARDATTALTGNLEHWYCRTCDSVWLDEDLTQTTTREAVTLPVLPPPAESIVLWDDLGQEVTGQTLTVDLFETHELQLNAGLLPEEAIGEITWKSSNTKIATVDKGLVTPVKPGTVTVTASLKGGKLSSSVTLKVIYLEEAGKLTARAEIPAIGLQSGFQTTMLVYGAGEEPMDPENLTFDILSEKEKDIASVDGNGIITAGSKSGTATVTAAIKNDPLGRKVTLKVKVIPTQTETLALLPLASDPARVTLLDASGQPTTDPDQAVTGIVFLDATDLEEENFLLRISSRSVNSLGAEQEPGSKGLKWVSTDSRIAAVKPGESGTAVVTVKKGAEGACVISAVTTDLAKKQADLTIYVRDYSPRLGSTSLTLNTNRSEGVTTSLLPSYGNGIRSVTVHEQEGKQGYAEANSPQFDAYCEEDTLFLRHRETLKNGTCKLLLKVTCENGETYPYKLSVKISNTLPTVTVKQQSKLNLFLTDGQAQFLLTAKGGSIEDVVLVDGSTASFTSTGFDPESGTLGLVLSQAYLRGEAPMDNKAELEITFAGYETPVRKSVTIGTENKAPKLTLSAPSGIVNVALEGEHSTLVSVPGISEAAQITVDASFAEAVVTGSQVKLILTGTTGGTATIHVTQPNWAEEVVLKYKVTVQSKLPTVKLKSSTLKLNTLLGEEAFAETVFVMPKGVSDFAVTGFACDKDPEGYTLTLDPDTGALTARLTDPKAADQTLRLYPILTHLPTGQQAGQEKPLNLKVDIYTGKPSVTLTASGKLDPIVPGSAITYTIKKLTNISGKPEAVRLEGNGAELFDTVLEGQAAVVTLKSGMPQETGKTRKLQLIFTIAGQEVAANVSIKVSQSSVKITAPKTLSLYQSNSRLACVLEMTAPEGASIQEIALNGKTAAQFDRALGEDAVTFVQLPTGSWLVSFKVSNPAYLTYGKSYTVYLDIIPRGNAENAKPTTVKLTVKTFK